MEYEAREAQIKDELTRLKMARKEGIEEGIEEGREEGGMKKALETAKAALNKGISVEIVAKITGLDIDKVRELQKECVH